MGDDLVPHPYCFGNDRGFIYGTGDAAGEDLDSVYPDERTSPAVAE